MEFQIALDKTYQALTYPFGRVYKPMLVDLALEALNCSRKHT